MNRLLSATFPFLLLVGLWWLVVITLEVPHFILPSPERVARVLVERLPLISGHAFTTASEIVCGLMLGTVLGFAVACLIGDSKNSHRSRCLHSSSVKRSRCLPLHRF